MYAGVVLLLGKYVRPLTGHIPPCRCVSAATSGSCDNINSCAACVVLQEYTVSLRFGSSVTSDRVGGKQGVAPAWLCLTCEPFMLYTSDFYYII